MALFFNGTNVDSSANVYFNNQASSQVFFNNALVWKRERNLFYNGGFGELGTPAQGLSEGFSWKTNEIQGANWLINTDGRSDWWFPAVTVGYSQVHITVIQREGAGQCLMYAGYGAAAWGHFAPIQVNITTPGTYTLNLPGDAIFIGVQALRGGVYINRVWQT